MTEREKNIISDIYNITQKAYINANTKEKQAKKKAQCFIIMHIMQTFGFWEEYKQRSEIIMEDKKQ